MTLDETLARPYRVVAHFDDPHELRVAYGELGVRLGGHAVVADTSHCCLEIQITDPDCALVAAQILRRHHSEVEILDFEHHCIHGRRPDGGSASGMHQATEAAPA
jgi:hypothetical protein